MRTGKKLFILLFCFVGSLTFAKPAITPPASCGKGVPIITTQYGPLCGVKQKSNGQQAYAYLGIPYAKPPVEALRWQPPQPITDWKPNVYSATQLASACPQPSPASPTGFIGKENCLYLNVWKPIKSVSKPLPVMVFIPGGGFITGQGGFPSYNGTYISSVGDVIIVTINYRLGALGFLRYEKNQSKINGNFALLDQLAALKWVHNNIANFGGDPKKVTIFGESAGAMSVGAHLFAIPASKKFFRAAIMESNVMSIRYATAQQAAKRNNQFVSLLCKIDHSQQCPQNAQWLRDLSLKTIMQAENQATPPGGVAGLLLQGMTKGILWAPITGVYPLAGQANNGYQAGTIPKPFVIGTNRDEGVFFIPGANRFSTNAYEILLAKNFGAANVKRILNYKANGFRPYNPASYHYNKMSDMTPAAQAMARVMTDYAFTGASIMGVERAWKQMQAAKLPVFGYRFTQQSNFNYAIYKRCGPKADNICHTEEIPYVFHNFIERAGLKQYTLPYNKITLAEKQLSKKMVKAWIGFAKDPVNWKKGWGYAPLNGALTGPYVNWTTPVQTIQHLDKLVNYNFWLSMQVTH